MSKIRDIWEKGIEEIQRQIAPLAGAIFRIKTILIINWLTLCSCEEVSDFRISHME